MIGTRYVPLGYVQLTVGGTVGGLSGTTGSLVIPTLATRVLLGCDTTNLRFRDDGGPLSTNVGMLLVANQQPFDYSGNLATLQFLSTAGPTTLNASYYRDDG